MAAIIALTPAQQEQQAEEERRRRRITLACAYCRYRKIRCDGAPVCKNCAEGSWKCEYVKVSAEENRAARERKAQSKARQSKPSSNEGSTNSTPARAPRRTASASAGSKRSTSASAKRNSVALTTSSSAPSLTPIVIHSHSSHEGHPAWHGYQPTPMTSSCPSPYTPSVLALSSQSQPPSLTPSTASTSPNSSFASFDSYPHPHHPQMSHQGHHHSMPATPYEHFGGSGPHDAVWGPPSPPEDAEVAAWEECNPYPHQHSLPPPHHQLAMGGCGAPAGYEMDQHYLPPPPQHHHHAEWVRAEPDMSAFKMYFDPSSQDAHAPCCGPNADGFPHPHPPHHPYLDQHGQPLSIVAISGAYPTPLATPTMGPDEGAVCFSSSSAVELGQGIVPMHPHESSEYEYEYVEDYSQLSAGHSIEHDHHHQQQQHFAPPPPPMNVSGWDAPLVPAEESQVSPCIMGATSSSGAAGSGSALGEEDYENLRPISPVMAVLEPEQDGYVDETSSLH